MRKADGSPYPFHELFDDTLVDIANCNLDIFSVQTGGEEKIRLFDPISQYVIESAKKPLFCRAIIYRNVAAWYSNNVRFTKNPTGKFHEEKGDILALTPWVDAVISGQRCYIINEQNFNKIFKFDEVIKNQVAASAPEIRGMEFIDDGDAFMEFLGKSTRQKNAMAKVIMQKRLEKIKKYPSKYIREQIESQPVI